MRRGEKNGQSMAVRHGGATLRGQTVETRRVEKCGRRNAKDKKKAILRRQQGITRQRLELGAMAFIPKFRWTWSKKQEERWWKSWRRWNSVGDGRNKLAQRFFLIPKNVTSERPTALLLAIILWFEALRAPEVANWEHKYRIEWRATDGRKGGAERTVWGTLLEMESFNDHAEERDQGATALVLDLAKAFERVSLPVVWVWATRFNVTKKILSVLCGYFEHERRVQFARVEVELLATAHCVAGRTE